MPAAGLRERIRESLSFETALFIIFLITLFIRFFFLDLKLLHHDEAVHAWFSYELLTRGAYIYNPEYHGPLLYFITAGMFSLFGDSDLVGRIIPALLGSLFIPLVYGLYRLGYLDRMQTLVAALFIALSPDLVYFSRFLRHDIFMLFFTFLSLVAFLYYLEYGRRRDILFAAIGLAGALCCKEEMPIIAIVLGSYLGFAIWKGRFSLPPRWKMDLVLATVTVIIIMAAFYSSFGGHPEVLIGPDLAINQTGWYRAIEHWSAMHGQCRICGPPYFYILLLLLYEVPIFFLGIFGTAQFLARETPLGESAGTIMGKIRSRFRKGDGFTDLQPFHPPPPPIGGKRAEFFGLCLWWMILTMAAYAYIGEKVPWLIIHQLLPMIFVAVYAMTPRKAAIAAVSVVFLILLTWHVAFVPADVNEPIVQVQNSEQLREVMAKIDASRHVAIASENYWPLPWYYRGDLGTRIAYYGRKVDEEVITSQDYDLAIAYDADSYENLPGFSKQTYRLNYWFSYYDNQNRLLEYYFLRDGKLGSMNIDVFTRITSPQQAGSVGR